MDNGKKFLQNTGALVASVAILFGTVWIISKAWKSGQKNSQ